MRLARVLVAEEPVAAWYTDEGTVALADLATAAGLSIPQGDDVLALLPGGSYAEAGRRISTYWHSLSPQAQTAHLKPHEVLLPIARPPKLLLLAGNYAKHVVEQGGAAAERAETFPYVFMKPPSTTLIPTGAAVQIPRCSPTGIDWELELGVVIGRRCRNVEEADALNCVAGYTIINDISDRKYRPNPSRKPRERDKFFDWLHGKWHDASCPCGPCVLSADAVPDPQQLAMRLTVNGQVEQDASTAEMVFPVAAIVSFLSQWITLEPGDIISTGTPDGVGNAKGRFLKPGDQLAGEIAGIGVLENPVCAGE